MPEIDEFWDLWGSTITIEPFLSRDGYGTALYGAAVSYPCRVNGSQRQITDRQGVERVSKALINLPGNPVIGPTDRITMPAGFVPSQPPILSVNPLIDDTGAAHHTEILI